ncbi:solute carrier family 26 member 6 isoform X1 [Eupeodes corollae]|uniref:solute carrier family 26 member 6 isoform X1 n=1 Tax=Eupeodes corollae TaxID=290404 RepID=UPI00249350EA|nr:solute carrier family 26 member 6 isoform X1 [Eupeodes corollae]
MSDTKTKKPPPTFDLKHVRKFAVEHLKKIQQGGPSIGCTSSKSSLPSTSQSNNNNNNNNNYTTNSLQFSDVYELEMNTVAKDLSTESEALTKTFLDRKPKSKPKLNIQRDVLNQEAVIKQTRYTARDKSVLFGLRKYWSTWNFLSLFTGIIPIFQWLPKYSVKNDLMGDIIAGFTVAIMNIPHGMAYGILAGVTASNGLYMAIFPVLVYLFLGTSRHISIGTFAVISIMTYKVVQTHATEDHQPGGEGYTPLEVVTATAIMTGVVHFLMSLMRLGTLSSLLSDPLVNGFTTAAAVHVMTSQLKDVLGVSVPRHKGAFKIVYTFIDLAKSLPAANLASIKICACVIVFMLIMNEFLKPWVAKRTRFPIPAELMAVVGGTLISKSMQFKENYGVALLGNIPLGLPTFKTPPLELLPIVAVDSIAIAVVSYSIVMSMGLTFAKKHSYEVRPNQELFAMSVGNIFGGCFSCIPMACSLSRSVIQEQTGGKTQVASFVSAMLLLATVLWIGPFFSTLPKCVLSGVIMVALKPMFMQARELKNFAQQGKLELLTWVSTFICVVFVDIDIGLLVGICVSLMTLYVKGLKPYNSLLGTIAGIDGVYVDIGHHNNAVEIPETKIFRYTGSLNFATRNSFKKSVYEAIKVDCQKLRQVSLIAVEANGGDSSLLNSFRVLILDFSCLAHLDMAGCRTLSEIKKEMRLLGVRLFIASPADRVYDTIVHSMALGQGPFEVYATLNDAVAYANACRNT